MIVTKTCRNQTNTPYSNQTSKNPFDHTKKTIAQTHGRKRHAKRENSNKTNTRWQHKHTTTRRATHNVGRLQKAKRSFAKTTPPEPPLFTPIFGARWMYDEAKNTFASKFAAGKGSQIVAHGFQLPDTCDLSKHFKISKSTNKFQQHDQKFQSQKLQKCSCYIRMFLRRLDQTLMALENRGLDTARRRAACGSNHYRSYFTFLVDHSETNRSRLPNDSMSTTLYTRPNSPHFSDPQVKARKKICKEGGLATTETDAYYFNTNG